MVELMVVIAIIGILTAVAAPSFSAYMARMMIQDQASALARAINLARSEAVRRSRPVSVCPSDQPESATPTCSTVWTNGWIVYVDENTPNQIDGNDTVIRVQPGWPNGGPITSDTSSNPIRFLSNGMGVGMAQTFTIAPRNGDTKLNKTITLSSTGRWTSQ